MVLYPEKSLEINKPIARVCYAVFLYLLVVFIQLRIQLVLQYSCMMRLLHCRAYQQRLMSNLHSVCMDYNSRICPTIVSVGKALCSSRTCPSFKHCHVPVQGRLHLMYIYMPLVLCRLRERMSRGLRTQAIILQSLLTFGAVQCCQHGSAFVLDCMLLRFHCFGGDCGALWGKISSYKVVGFSL